MNGVVRTRISMTTSHKTEGLLKQTFPKEELMLEINLPEVITSFCFFFKVHILEKSISGKQENSLLARMILHHYTSTYSSNHTISYK